MINQYIGSDTDSTMLGLYHCDTLLMASIFYTGFCAHSDIIVIEHWWQICVFICSNPAMILSLEAQRLGFTGLIPYCSSFLAGLPPGRT